MTDRAIEETKRFGDACSETRGSGGDKDSGACLCNTIMEYLKLREDEVDSMGKPKQIVGPICQDHNVGMGGGSTVPVDEGVVFGTHGAW